MKADLISQVVARALAAAKVGRVGVGRQRGRDGHVHAGAPVALEGSTEGVWVDELDALVACEVAGTYTNFGGKAVDKVPSWDPYAAGNTADTPDEASYEEAWAHSSHLAGAEGGAWAFASAHRAGSDSSSSSAVPATPPNACPTFVEDRRGTARYWRGAQGNWFSSGRRLMTRRGAFGATGSGRGQLCVRLL